jgi:HlyD family secretion protein
MRRIAAIFALVTIALVTLLAIKLRAQEAALHGPTSGSGEIEGTEVRVASKLSARLVTVTAKKGMNVRKGDVLAQLDCTEPRQYLLEAQSRLASAEANVKGAQAQVTVAAGQQQAYSKAVAAGQAQAEALAAQRDASKRQAERLEAVAGDVSFSNRDQVRASAVGLEHQVTAAMATSQASMEQARAAGGQGKVALAQVEAAELAVKVAQTAVVRAGLMVDECDLVAPRDAAVEDVLFEVGELTAPGAVVVKLLDLSEVKATVYVPNAELSAVKAGGAATVVADALPGEEFKAVVRSVALEAEFTPRNIQTRTDRDRLVYPVEVRIDNPQQRLRAGMPVQITLVGK